MSSRGVTPLTAGNYFSIQEVEADTLEDSPPPSRWDRLWLRLRHESITTTGAGSTRSDISTGTGLPLLRVSLPDRLEFDPSERSSASQPNLFRHSTCLRKILACVISIPCTVTHSLMQVSDSQLAKSELRYAHQVPTAIRCPSGREQAGQPQCMQTRMVHFTFEVVKQVSCTEKMLQPSPLSECILHP